MDGLITGFIIGLIVAMILREIGEQWRKRYTIVRRDKPADDNKVIETILTEPPVGSIVVDENDVAWFRYDDRDRFPWATIGIDRSIEVCWSQLEQNGCRLIYMKGMRYE